MLAVLIAELTSWRQKAAGQSVAVGVLALGIPWLMSGGQLLVMVMAILGFVAWLAWNFGFESWSGIKLRQWVEQRKRGGLSVIGGKLLAFAIVTSLMLALLSPLMFLVIREWGIPWDACLSILGIMLASGGCVMACILMPIGSDSSFKGVPGAVLASAWLIVTLLVEPIRLGNPINQLTALLAARPGESPLLGCLAILGLTLLAMAAGSGLTGRHGRKGVHHG